MGKDKFKFRINIDELPYFMAFAIIIFAQVFNESKLGSSIGNIEIPFIITCLLCGIYIIIKGFNLTCLTGKEVGLIAGFVSYIVVLTCNRGVVEWDKNDYSLLLSILLYTLMTWKSICTRVFRNIMKLYSLVAIVVCCSLLYEIFSGITFKSAWGTRVSITVFGIIKDPNYLSAFLTPVFAYLIYSYFFEGRKRLFVLLMAFLTFGGIFSTGSRGAFVTVLAVTAVVIIRYMVSSGVSYRKIMFFVLLITLILGGYFALSQTSLFDRMFNFESYKSNVRLVLWGYSLIAFFKNPILGSGLQSGAYYVGLYTSWNAVHNCFIDMLTGSGLIGAFLFFELIKPMFKIERQKISFIIVFFVGCFAPLFFIDGYMAMTFWFPLALCRQAAGCLKRDSMEELIWR